MNRKKQRSISFRANLNTTALSRKITQLETQLRADQTVIAYTCDCDETHAVLTLIEWTEEHHCLRMLTALLAKHLDTMKMIRSREVCPYFLPLSQEIDTYTCIPRATVEQRISEQLPMGFVHRFLI